MINDVLTAITRKLSSTFPDYDIYDDKVPQDFVLKSFFVLLLNPSFIPGMDRRYRVTLPFNVHYWGTSQRDRNDMAFKLHQVLRKIETLDKVKLIGKSMSGEHVDDVLHFFVTYDLNLTEIETKVLMEILELK